jgi:hypothetical protein
MRSTWKQQRHYFLMATLTFTHRQKEQRSKASQLNVKLLVLSPLGICRRPRPLVLVFDV